MKKDKKTNWLDKLHKEELRILDELDRICKKNKLKYFLSGGSLIGAVRHHGFIPWDDDIDVGMPRSDYEKFIKCCKTDLKDDFYLDAFEVNTNKFHLYAKLKLKNTIFMENYATELSGVDHGIFIDIFPYDNIDEMNSKDHLKKDKFRHNITKLVYLKSGLTNYLSEYRKSHKIIMFFVDVVLKICPRKLLLSMAKRKISANKNDNSLYISNMTGGLSLEKETHKREEVFPAVRLEFEGKKYCCPKEYDKLLTKIYGDYMQLPPVEKRVTHNPVMVKFSDGETIEFSKEGK